MDDPTKISLTSRTSAIKASELTDATVAPDPKTTPQIVSPEEEREVKLVPEPRPPRDDFKKELNEVIEQAEKVIIQTVIGK